MAAPRAAAVLGTAGRPHACDDVGAAAHHRFMEALVAPVSNGGNQHELGGTLLDRWRAAYSGTLLTRMKPR